MELLKLCKHKDNHVWFFIHIVIFQTAKLEAEKVVHVTILTPNG